MAQSAMMGISYPMRSQKCPDTKQSKASVSGTGTRPGWMPVVLLLLLAIVYVIITCLFTYPLFLNATNHTPVGGFSGDQCKTIWFFWWTDTALFELGQNPFWTNTIYYPHGTGVGYHICLFTCLTAIGIAKLLGVAAGTPLVYNVSVFLSFVLTGLGSFWLIRHITGSAFAAFAASLLVAFSPYRLWHLDQLNLLSMEWGIFAAYFAIRYLDKPRPSYLAGAVAFIVVSFYASLTNTMLAVLFLVAYAAVFRGWMKRGANRRRTLGGMAIGVAVAFLLVLPGLLSLSSADSEWNVLWPDMERYSADLVYLFVPAAQGSAAGSGQEYLGWFLLILVGSSVWFARRRETRRWALLGLIFTVVSLGPTLLIAGHRLLPGLMPQRWLLEVVPYFDLSRSPVRTIALAHLALAVVAGLGLEAWLSSVRKRFRGRLYGMIAVLTIAGVSSVLLWEHGRGRIALVPMTVPAVYSQVAADPSIEVICDFPVSDKLQLGNWYMYWQTAHGRKSANGYLAHRSRSARGLLDQVAAWKDIGPDEARVLRDAGIDAVVYHDPYRESELIRLREVDTPDPSPNGE